MVLNNTEFIAPSRLDRLADIISDHPDLTLEALTETFAPGTLGCHEALHTTSIIMATLHDQLLGHAAIAANPAWFKLAQKAFDNLVSLYQAIGSDHFPALRTVEVKPPARLQA